MNEEATGDQPAGAAQAPSDASAAVGADEAERGGSGDPDGRWWRGGGPVTDDVRLVHAGFERETAARLRRMLRAEVGLDLAGAERITFGEWLSGHGDAVVFARVELPGTSGVTLAVDTAFGMRAIERFLGGVGDGVSEREPTELEAGLLGDILSAPVSALEEVFASQLTAPPRLSFVTTQPRMLRSLPSADLVLVMNYHVTTDVDADQRGTLSLCYPEEIVTPVLEQAKAPPEVTAVTAVAGDPALTGLMADVEVELIARLRPSRFAADDLRRLRIGDVLSLDHRTDDTIELSVSDAVALTASLGRRGQHLAVRVERWDLPAAGSAAKEFAT